MPYTVHIPAGEIWLENAMLFVGTPAAVIEIEHSLSSIYKWESIWKKPFLDLKEYTKSEFASYVECMTLTKDIPKTAYMGLTKAISDDIVKYMADPMTATTISSKNRKKGPNKIITAEVIYYWMIELGIPFECQYWHLNQLMTLIAVCFEKNGGQKKMSDREILSQYASLNAFRRAKLGTKG